MILLALLLSYMRSCGNPSFHCHCEPAKGCWLFMVCHGVLGFGCRAPPKQWKPCTLHLVQACSKGECNFWPWFHFPLQGETNTLLKMSRQLASPTSESIILTHQKHCIWPKIKNSIFLYFSKNNLWITSFFLHFPSLINNWKYQAFASSTCFSDPK